MDIYKDSKRVFYTLPKSMLVYYLWHCTSLQLSTTEEHNFITQKHKHNPIYVTEKYQVGGADKFQTHTSLRIMSSEGIQENAYIAFT